MADTSNVDIGPCSVYLQGVDLGHTQGGVTLTYEPSSVELKVDQYGDTPVDYALLGESVMVTCNLAEITEANVAKAITNSTLSTSGGDSMVKLGATAGARYSTNAGGQLILHPLANAANDLSGDVTLYNVIIDDSVELNYSPSEQKILQVTFKALIDENKAEGNRLGHYGTHIS